MTNWSDMSVLLLKYAQNNYIRTLLMNYCESGFICVDLSENWLMSDIIERKKWCFISAPKSPACAYVVFVNTIDTLSRMYEGSRSR